MKANSKVSEVKEIRFTPNTDDHDFDFKAKHAENFLKDGNKVKAYVQFKGRAIQFKERGELLILKFAERLAEFGVLESLPKMEGKRMLAIWAPKSQKKKTDKNSGPKEPREPREPRPPRPERPEGTPHGPLKPQAQQAPAATTGAAPAAAEPKAE